MINDIQLSAYVTIICARACGILSKVKINENMEAVARTNSTTPDKEAVFNNTVGISSIFSSLYIKNETIKPYITATDAASVGVKIPP
jgi:hypothetical protein